MGVSGLPYPTDTLLTARLLRRESVLENRCPSCGFKVLFLLKFHPELNLIKRCWGCVKWYYHQLPPSSKNATLKEISWRRSSLYHWTLFTGLLSTYLLSSLNQSAQIFDPDDPVHEHLQVWAQCPGGCLGQKKILQPSTSPISMEGGSNGSNLGSVFLSLQQFPSYHDCEHCETRGSKLHLSLLEN